MNELLPVLILLLIILTFGGVVAVLTGFLGPRLKASPSKRKSYECGLDGEPMSGANVSVNYYLTAILFILFDIEIIFMYPWAIFLKKSLSTGYGLQAFLAMTVFLFVFVFGLLWEILSKALKWD